MVEVKGRRGRRRKQLLDDFKETRIYRNLKEEAPDQAVWRARFGKRLRICRKTDYRVNEKLIRIRGSLTFEEPTNCQQKQPECHANLEVFGQVWMQIPFFRGMTLRRWVNGSRRFKTNVRSNDPGSYPRRNRPSTLIIL